MESRKYRTCGHGCVRPGFVRVQLATRALRNKEGNAMTGTYPSITEDRLSRASDAQSHRVPILFAMEGT